MINIEAARPSEPLKPLEGTSWYRNEDIPTTITIDDASSGNNIDLSNATLKVIVKQSTNPPGDPIHEYTSDPVGGIEIMAKNADRIIAKCTILKAHLASLPVSTEVELEAQLIIAEPTSILKIAKFKSRIAA